MPPPMRSDRSVRFIIRRKRSPTTMKNSRITNAIPTSRRISFTRRSRGTLRIAEMNSGMLPSGSVISRRSTVADRKVYSTVSPGRPA